MSVRGKASVAAMTLAAGVAFAAQQTAVPKMPPPTPAQVTEARDVGRTFAQVAAQLSPSVVRISVEKVVARSHRGRGPSSPFGENPFKGTPFEHFFDDENQFGFAPEQAPKLRGMGSGVVVDP
ncbi:MAG TPA: hypothetical protein VHB97_01175, partial [Polyangia bacterium]|nr:hypothetical protein [Polyangia bacterium]